MLRRKHDWPKLLHEYLNSVRDRPFKWGQHDCALFFCGAVEAMTGVDLARDFRGEYSSRGAAVRRMRAFADGGLEQLVEKRAAAYSIPEVPVAFAQRGDGLLFETPQGQGPALGIVALDGMHVLSVSPGKTLFVGRVMDCRRAWRI